MAALANTDDAGAAATAARPRTVGATLLAIRDELRCAIWCVQLRAARWRCGCVLGLTMTRATREHVAMVGITAWTC